jgi:hypothetical protein
VPQSFKTVGEYKRVFEPLLLEEALASLMKEKQFMNPDSIRSRSCLCIFDISSSVAPFEEVRIKVQKLELFKKEDIVVIAKTFEDGKKCSFLGFIQEIKEKCVVKILDSVYNEKVKGKPIDTQWDIIKVS